LEFLGMAITVRLLLLDGKEQVHPCLLALGDNTSAVGWMFRSGKIEPKSAYYSAVKFIARDLADQVIQNRALLAGQHMEGKLNEVADLLSFEGKEREREHSLTKDNPPNDILTRRVLLHYPQLVPHNFEIRHLPSETASFACAALQIIELSWTLNRKHPTGTLNAHLNGGRNSSPSTAATTPASIEYPQTSSQSFSEVSLSTSEKESSTTREDVLESVQGRWLRRLYEVPQATWLRRFGNVNGPAPFTFRGATTGPVG
jgi:hypothetical protein